MSRDSRDVVAGVLTGSIGAAAMALIVVLNPSPRFVSGMMMGMALSVGLACLYLLIRDMMNVPEHDDGGR